MLWFFHWLNFVLPPWSCPRAGRQRSRRPSRAPPDGRTVRSCSCSCASRSRSRCLPSPGSTGGAGARQAAPGKAAPAPGRGVGGGEGPQVKEAFREPRVVTGLAALHFHNQNEFNGKCLEMQCTVHKLHRYIVFNITTYYWDDLVRTL